MCDYFGSGQPGNKQAGPSYSIHLRQGLPLNLELAITYLGWLANKLERSVFDLPQFWDWRYKQPHFAFDEY